MEGTETSATAVLVDRQDAGGRPTTTTLLVAREELEEALASDDAPELLLEVQLGDAGPRNLSVAWQRGDLETVLAATGPGGITFAFEPSEIYRALEHPDFEAHGIREAVLLTVAAASASTAMAVSTAQAGLVEGTGAGVAATVAAVSPGHDEASTASTLATPAVGHDEASTASTLANPAAAKDEAGLTARGIGVTMPGADEMTLAARGIEQQPTPAIHDEATLVDRGVQPAPVPVDSGSGLELPSVDPATAAFVGGLAGAGLLIVGGTFVARRRIGTT